MEILPEQPEIHEIIREKVKKTRLAWVSWFVGCSLIIGWIDYMFFGLLTAIVMTGILITIVISVGFEKENNGLPKPIPRGLKAFLVVLSLISICIEVFTLIFHNTVIAREMILLVLGVVGIVSFIHYLDYAKKEKIAKSQQNNDKKFNQVMTVAIIGHTQERHSTSINHNGEISGGNTSTTESPIRLDGFALEEDLAKIITQKPNGNLFVSGTSGSGKSTAIYVVNENFKNNPRLYFAYKPEDVYFKMGIPVMDITKNIPDVFAGNKEALVNAFMVITKIDKPGITASEIQPLVRNAVNHSKNWQTFEDELKRISKNANSIQRTAVEHILLILPNLRIESHPVELELDKDIVLDMSGCVNDEVRGFYTEIILYQIFEKIRSRAEVPTDEKLIICIDEVHRILKNQNSSIIEIMAREMRPYAMLWLTTQNYSDLTPSIKNQMYTQLVFNTTHERDVDELEKINKSFGFAINTLHHGEFIDVRQLNVHKKIDVYKIRNLKIENKPKNEYQGISIIKKETQQLTLDALATTSGSVELHDGEKTLREKILQVLDKSDKSLAISRVANALYKKESNREEKDKEKLVINNEVNKLVKEDVVDKQKLVDEKGKKESHCFRKNENLSKFHVTLQNRSVKLLRNNKITILNEASHQGIQGEDITLDDCVIECETGLKESLGEFDKKVMSHTKSVIIVIPNNEQKERYLQLASVKSGKAKVVLLSELIRAVKEFENGSF